MGNICGMDTYQRLCTQYLEDFTKTICLQQAKQLLDSKVPDIKTKLTHFYDVFQKTAHQQIDQKASVAFCSLEESVVQFKKQHQNIIKQLLLNEQNVQQMFHVQQLKKPIEESKNKAKTEVSNQRAKIFTQIDQVHQKLLNQFEMQKPFIKLYQQLPPEVKIQISVKAKQQFKLKIAQQNDIKLKQINDLIGDEKFKQDLKSFDPTGQLNGFVEQSIKMIEIYKEQAIQQINRIIEKNQKQQGSKLIQNSL